MVYSKKIIDFNEPGGEGPSSPAKGFFGRLWGRIKRNIGSILGSLAGGPIGGILGGLLDKWLDAGVDINYSREGISVSIEEPKYPITQTEEIQLDKIHNLQIAPMVVYLVNLIDQEINIQSTNRTRFSNDVIISKANKVLHAISIINANNTTLVNFGEGRRSKNFILNKIAILEMYLDIVEKSVVKYVEENTNGEFKLVLETMLVSTVKNIQKYPLSWQGQEVHAKIKKYMLRGLETNGNQTDVIIVNTDPESDEPLTNAGHSDSEINASKDINNKNSLLKIGAVVTVTGIVGIILNRV